MGYGITQIWKCRKEAGALCPAARTQDAESYETLRDAVIGSFLPHASNTTKNTELSAYHTALQHNDGYLETVLYGACWDDLLPNERLAIEHLYYEDAALVDKTSHFYQAMHGYGAARRGGDKALAKQHLTEALWETLQNAPYAARNALEQDKARRRRKAQAVMLNSPNLATHTLPTPDYIVESIRQRYAATPLEELLPDITFPLEANARAIAEDIQRINADMHQDIEALIAEARGEESPPAAQQKSMVTDAVMQEEATEAFVVLTTQIVEGVRPEIEAEIDRMAAEGTHPDEMDIRLKEILSRYEDTTIPYKMDMLATHFNGKLTELEQRKLGYSHYIWHSQDDPKVRPDHAANDGKEFSWDDPPATGHPGEDYNCRCWPEPSRKGGNIEPFYPELLILTIIVDLRRSAAGAAIGIAKAISKIFKNPISRRPKGVPKEWRKERTNDGKGYIYKDPKSKGHTYVKVSKGDPMRTKPGQQVDNVRIQINGRNFDKNGNIVPQQSQESHIPLKEFDKFDLEKFK